MRVFFRAKNKAGLPLPWAYTRSLIARAWKVAPWEVDAAPWDEVETELRLRRVIGWSDVAPELGH